MKSDALEFGGSTAWAYQNILKADEAKIKLATRYSNAEINLSIYISPQEFWILEKENNPMITVENINRRNLHIRHKIRIYLSIAILAFGVFDLLLNLFKIPSLASIFLDLLWILGATGLLGTSYFLATDNEN